MKTGKKISSVLLILAMIVSLIGGAFAAGTDPGAAFVKAGELKAGSEYLIVTEYDGKYYGLTCSGGSLGAAEIAVTGDEVASADDVAVWV
ncbi:MAG: hypothetical protein ILP09_07650, partial [Oscillospiraceae bacterium]|nr:hypothetical protein [Oscillospiraceae bacterium]